MIEKGQSQTAQPRDDQWLDLKKRYETLLEHSNSIIGEVDREGRYMYVGPSVERLLGYRPQDLVGTNAFDYIHPDDVEPVASELNRIFEDGPGAELLVRMRFPHADGGWRLLEAQATIYRRSGGEPALVYHARDVTEHAALVEELRQAEARFQALAATSSNYVTVIDQTGVFEYVSPSAQVLEGLPPEEFVGRNVLDFVHPDDRGRIEEELERLGRHAGAEGYGRVGFLDAKGGWRTIEYHSRSHRDHVGRMSIVVSNHDVTEQAVAEQALRDSEERLERALAATGLGLWDWDLTKNLASADAYFHRLLGYRPGEIDFKPGWLLRCVHPDDIERGRKELVAHLKGQTDYYESEIRMRDKSLGWRWVRGRAQVVDRDETGRALRLIGTVKDIEAEVAARHEAQRANERVALLLESTEEGICGLDESGRISFINPAGAGMLGAARSELQGQDFHQRVMHTREDGSPYPSEESPLIAALRRGQPVQRVSALFWRDRDNSFPVSCSISPIRGEKRINGAVLVFRDESVNRELNRRLSYQASHDPVTGLYNRSALEERLAGLLKQGGQHAFCYLDLDQFRLINGVCGHEAGDELLRQLAQVLAGLVDADDMLVRLGGDEFGILLRDCSLERAEQAAERLRQAVTDFHFEWGERSYRTGASVGVVAVNSQSDGLSEILSAADAACYVAKEAGRSQVHVASPQDPVVPRRRGEMEWVARTREALEHDRLRLYAQPIVALAVNNGPRRAEILLRMIDDDGTLILPRYFLVAAERHFLMPQVDRWVLRRTLATLAASERLRAGRDTRYCINLSATSLGQPGLLEEIVALIESSGVPPSLLCFEITETAAMSNMPTTMRLIRGLKRLGCQFALDDFGTGMSSLTYLQQLPVDYIKIDGRFIRHILHDRVDDAIVRAIDNVATTIGIDTIAEHVESQAVLAHLAAIGVDYVQGFHTGRPAPIDQLWQSQD